MNRLKNSLNPHKENQAFFENSLEDKLVSTKELAKLLKCSQSYIKKLRKMGKIYPEIRFPRFVRYRLSTVIAALKKWSNYE